MTQGMRHLAVQFMKPADNQNLFLRAEMFRVLGMVQHCLERTGQESEDSLVARLRVYLREHIQEDIDRGMAAAELGISPSHLTTLLRQQAHTHFSAILREERLAEAQALLQYSNQQIKAIASQVGFNDTSYFVRVFREHMGISPQAWRKQNVS